MAKHHQRSNREMRKPKTEKKKPATAQTSRFSPAPAMAKPMGPAAKKGR
jgi:Recombinase